MQVDVPWAVGFIAGAVLASVVLGAFGMSGGILRLIFVVGGGVLGGILGEKLFGKK